MAFALFLAFLYALGTVVVLPSPQELVLAAAAKAPAWTVILVAVCGRAIGAYLLFLAGDRLKRWQRFRHWRRKGAKAQKWVACLEKGVTRFGAPALFTFLLIPGFPDTAVSYVLALFNRRPWAFALAFALASALRLSLAFLGIYYAL
ncbi:MAG: VTT domain-containing protein, partial [Candidatus Bipolaricaulaceae bacterium]